MVKNLLPTWRKALAAAVLVVAPPAAVAADVGPATERTLARLFPVVVTDWRTGLALHGMDPVAYFADAAAVPGEAAQEFAYAGATWRFRNAGNRGAFIADPEIYGPRFGGHDPIAAARGVVTPGNPLVWLVYGGRLYLFHSPKAREAFRADPRQAVAAAAAKWPALAAASSVTGSVPGANRAPAHGARPPDPHKR